MAQIIREQAPAKTLAEIVRREVQAYEVGGVGGRLIAVLDDSRQRYALLVIVDRTEPLPVWVTMLAEVVGEYVLILEDRTDKPLVDALMVNGGISRDKIVLAYTGETLPAPTDS
jgi:hypothetical protein